MTIASDAPPCDRTPAPTDRSLVRWKGRWKARGWRVTRRPARPAVPRTAVPPPAGPPPAGPPPATRAALGRANIIVATLNAAATLASAWLLVHLLPAMVRETALGVVGLTAVAVIVTIGVCHRRGEWAACFGLAVALLVGLLGTVTGLQLLDLGWPQPGWFGLGWRDLLASTGAGLPSGQKFLAVTLTGSVATGFAIAAGCLRIARAWSLPPTVLLLVVAAGLAEPSPAECAVAATALGLQAAAVARRGRRASGRVRVLPALAAVAAMAATALAVTPHVPDRPRQVAVRPVDEVSGFSPVAFVADWQNPRSSDAAGATTGTTSRIVFTATRSGGQGSASPIVWATLEHYDGLTWSTGDTLRPSALGETAPSEPATALTVSTVRLPGPWLPRPGPGASLPTTLHGRDLLVADSGDLGAATPDAAAHYTVTAAADSAEPTQLRQVQVRHTAPQGDPLTATALRATAGASSDYDTLLALQAWGRGLRHDPSATSGQSRSLLRAVASGERPGTSDQIVASYALLARSLGYRSRVVVGFAPAQNGPVTTRDVVAWPEVWLDQWRPFYPVTVRGAASTDEVKRSAVQAVPATPPSAEQAAERPTAAPKAALARPLPLAALVTLVALLLAGVLAGLLGVRRRRRRHGSPDDRVLRAWRQTCRRSARRQTEPAQALTADQMAAAIGERLGHSAGVAAHELAGLAQSLLFAGRVASEEDAVRAWVLADRVCSRRLRRRGDVPASAALGEERR